MSTYSTSKFINKLKQQDISSFENEFNRREYNAFVDAINNDNSSSASSFTDIVSDLTDTANSFIENLPTQIKNQLKKLKSEYKKYFKLFHLTKFVLFELISYNQEIALSYKQIQKENKKYVKEINTLKNYVAKCSCEGDFDKRASTAPVNTATPATFQLPRPATTKNFIEANKNMNAARDRNKAAQDRLTRSTFKNSLNESTRTTSHLDNTETSRQRKKRNVSYRDPRTFEQIHANSRGRVERRTLFPRTTDI